MFDSDGLLYTDIEHKNEHRLLTDVIEPTMQILEQELVTKEVNCQVVSNDRNDPLLWMDKFIVQQILMNMMIFTIKKAKPSDLITFIVTKDNLMLN